MRIQILKIEEKCYEICDFCVFYRFNPGILGEYINKGCCMKHYLPEDPDYGCEYFVCRICKNQDINRT